MYPNMTTEVYKAKKQSKYPVATKIRQMIGLYHETSDQSRLAPLRLKFKSIFICDFCDISGPFNVCKSV